jgi:hypothetical protein
MLKNIVLEIFLLAKMARLQFYGKFLARRKTRRNPIQTGLLLNTSHGQPVQ